MYWDLIYCKNWYFRVWLYVYSSECFCYVSVKETKILEVILLLVSVVMVGLCVLGVWSKGKVRSRVFVDIFIWV